MKVVKVFTSFLDVSFLAYFVWIIFSWCLILLISTKVDTFLYFSFELRDSLKCMFLFFSSATVHITVSDVNEYSPTFTEPSYVRQVDEGRIYAEILRVEAKDQDCTPKFGDVCKYEILTSDQPFVIDMDGVIR